MAGRKCVQWTGGENGLPKEGLLILPDVTLPSSLDPLRKQEELPAAPTFAIMGSPIFSESLEKWHCFAPLPQLHSMERGAHSVSGWISLSCSWEEEKCLESVVNVCTALEATSRKGGEFIPLVTINKVRVFDCESLALIKPELYLSTSPAQKLFLQEKSRHFILRSGKKCSLQKAVGVGILQPLWHGWENMGVFLLLTGSLFPDWVVNWELPATAWGGSQEKSHTVAPAQLCEPLCWSSEGQGKQEVNPWLVQSLPAPWGCGEQGKEQPRILNPIPASQGQFPHPQGCWVFFLEGPAAFFMCHSTAAVGCGCPWLSPAIAEHCKSSLFYFMNCKNYHTFHRYLRTR